MLLPGSCPCEHLAAWLACLVIYGNLRKPVIAAATAGVTVLFSSGGQYPEKYYVIVSGFGWSFPK